MTCPCPVSVRLLDSVQQGTSYNISIIDYTIAIPSPIFLWQPRDYGVQLLSNLRVDAKTLGRWYIVTLMGQRAGKSLTANLSLSPPHFLAYCQLFAGHLALGIAKGAASTVTMIPEDYEDGVSFKTLADTIEASMIKRLAAGRTYGTLQRRG